MSNRWPQERWRTKDGPRRVENHEASLWLANAMVGSTRGKHRGSSIPKVFRMEDRVRRNDANFGQTCSNFFLNLTGLNLREELQELKRQQFTLFTSETSKIIFRSRVWSMEQYKTCLCFMFQKIHKGSSVIHSIKEEGGSVISSQTNVLKICRSFFAELYNRKSKTAQPPRTSSALLQRS